ncbi:response regulator transcription factor [Alteromonas sp. RKMC-009]|uniref:response regulator transcription factor n=1 Tax=Alteromonas sp. RKMC-009 TaxID=2267264 RepID=UPI000C46C612|nr:response regulator transcription factor [Alteromonas sp. RKMC-009]AYA63915.1 response regulator transcription factor [Alteromonas sp. RKMC-009]MBT82279.1 DNA-binding response regulator [Alteromonadaceae bacterium]MEC7690793.1 response regulator transcription factor [Pseudomonadota bacterium]
MQAISLLIVEDQSLVRDAIASLLDLEDDITVTGKCVDGEAAISWLSNNPHPDMILSDIEMPNLSGLDMARKLQDSGFAGTVVFMTTFSKPGYIKRAMQLGAKGFILKESDSDYLISALRKINRGERVIDPELALLALDDNNPLSEKERKALKLASDGLKTKEIASQLFLSEGTIRNYLSESIAKLGATNRVDAARIAEQKGWL